MRDVDQFAADHNLVDIVPLLKKGAIVAQDPDNFENFKQITEDEKQHIRNETLHKWKHPAALYYTIIICSVGAAVQGWDQTGSNGANLSFPQEFGIGNGHDKSNPNYDRDNWLVGLVNAAPYIGSALMSVARLYRHVQMLRIE